MSWTRSQLHDSTESRLTGSTSIPRRMSSGLSPNPGDEKNVQNNNLKRIYSDETVESPFGSNLVTPDDQQGTQPGINERVKSILGYFDSKELINDDLPSLSGVDSEIKVVSVVRREDQRPDKKEDSGSQRKEDETSNLLSISLDSSSSQVASPILSSSSSDVIHQTGLGSMYTLPNDHIVVESPGPVSYSSPEDEVKLLIDSDSMPVFRNSDLGTTFWAKELGPTMSLFTCRALVYLGIRLVFFLPWCVAVGGALLFSPDHLEILAFRTGYLDALYGIRRYAHWAEYGFQHIVAFLTFLVLLTWITPTIGFLLIGGLLAQFCWAWHTFLLDRNIPLGEDDRQTVYLLATSTWLNDTTVNIRKIGDSFYGTERREDKDIDSAVTGCI